MKKIILGAVCAIVLSSCGSGHKTTETVDSSATPAAALLERLHKAVADSAVYFGHHDDTAYGHDWRYVEGRSDVLETAGKYPGLMNWDLGLIEYGDSAELDGVPFDFIRQEVRKQNARGGINSFSWHVRNPKSGGDAWDVSMEPVHEIVVPGTAMNDTLRAWIGRAADFIGSLTDEQGQRIPVLFRPWHEHHGNWFWWGRKYSTVDEHKALWKLTRDVFDEHGIDNVVWVYSYDLADDSGETEARYPGHEFVDVVGADAYHGGGEAGTEYYRATVRQRMQALQDLTAGTDKLIAFTETGQESVVMPTWFTEVLLPLIKEYPISYVCVWRNAWDKPEHFYAPYKGHPAEDDFRKFTQDPRVIMAGELTD
ncbi:MAG: glycoside hydrolase family 26 protein [Muribaculaceae bacterium]|nr:glycoside hydrolase family 26 protein [Muribaculaceae bacterium]